MVEVISLLSSPLKSPGLPTRQSPCRVPGRKSVIYSPGDAGSIRDLSSISSTSSKRRKLNGPTTQNIPRRGPSGQATLLLPAFDDGLPDTFRDAKFTEYDCSDPIVFSSAPQSRMTKKTSITTVHDLSDDLPEDIFGDFPPLTSRPSAASTSRQPLAKRTANLLTRMRQEVSSSAVSKATTGTIPARKPNQFRMKGAASAGASVVDDIFSSSPSKSVLPRGRKSKLSEADRTARAELKASKNAEKEAEKERKRLEKEEKVREKQRADDIAEVNKVKTEKKISAREMIVDMSAGFRDSSLGHEIEAYMKELEVETNYVDEEIDISSTEELAFPYPGNVVKWRRKAGARYNEDLGHWERIERPTVEHEKHVMVHLTAVEFATIAAHPSSPRTPAPINERAMEANLDNHIAHLRSLAPDSKPIYLIESLDSWLRKNVTAKNRVYTAAVLAQDGSKPQAPSSNLTARPKKRKKQTLPALDLSHFDSDLIERLQLHLQLHPLRPLIHLTTSATSTASWIKSFTEHISTIPYRRLKLNDNLSSASFCMDSGQVKTGENAFDTYIRMLQEVQRVTPSMAYGIAGQYANVKTLVQNFKRDGPLMLEDVKKTLNKDGAASDRRLGPQVSRRLYKVFMGMDPESMDGIA